MSDITDSIQDSVENAGKSKINSKVAFFVAITATFMALCNVKDANIVQAMSQAQAKTIDTWSFYQAKSTRQAVTEDALEIIKLQHLPANDSIIKKYEEQISRYKIEKAELKVQAEAYQKEYDDINKFDDQFDMTDALLTISIAMFGITAITQKKWLLYFSIMASMGGIFLGIAAFLNINIHSDMISKILS